MDDKRVVVECDSCLEYLTQHDLIYMTDYGYALCDSCADKYLIDIKNSWRTMGEALFG